MWFFKSKKTETSVDKKYILKMVDGVINHDNFYNPLEAWSYDGIEHSYQTNWYKFYVTCSRAHFERHIGSKVGSGAYFYCYQYWNEIHMRPDIYHQLFKKSKKWIFQQQLRKVKEKYCALLFEEQVVFRELFYQSFQLMTEVMQQPEIEEETYYSLRMLCDEMLTFLQERKLLTSKTLNDRIRQEISDAQKIKQVLLQGGN